MVGQTISHYRIVSKLGEGGMGVVYLAEDIVLRRRVAIKTLTNKNSHRNRHFRSRFLREARTISTLSHQHIAAIYDYGETSNAQPYIVMELVEGTTLKELIYKRALTVSQAVKIIIQVAEALSEAHRHGIVHRDIKPSNIAISNRDIVKVLDFGLAKQLADRDDAESEGETAVNTETIEGVILGTPRYYSPEQALGLRIDPRSDIFSLGSVLYECITGRPAFPGSKHIEISASVIRDDPPAPSVINGGLSPELDRITAKALAKKPEARYQTCAELIADLQAIDQAVTGSTQTVTKPNNTSRVTQTIGSLTNVSKILTRPRIPVWWLVVGTIASVCLLLLIWFRPWQRPHQPTDAALRLYDDAVDELHQGAFFRASKMLEQVVQEDDHFALAHARLAEANSELDNSEKAKDELLRARELVPDPGVLPKIDSSRFDAVTAMVKRDFAKAILDFQGLVTLTPDKEKQHALIDLGRAFEKYDQPDKAIEAYEKARSLDPKSAAANLRLGVIYGRRQLSDKAFLSFDQATRLFEATAEIEGLAEVSLQRAVLLGQLGKVKEAHDELTKALEKATVLTNQDKRIRVLLNLSNNEIIAGNPAEAQQYSLQATSLAQQNKMENLTTQGIIDIGVAHFVKGNYKEAEIFFQEGLRLAQLYKGGRSEARALLMLASLRNHQNDPEAARDFAQRALPFYQQGGYRKEFAQAYSILGHAHDQAGEYETALRVFQQQLDLAQQVGDQPQIALSHEGLGVAFNHQQRYSEALEQFSQQYEIAKQLGSSTLIGYSAMNRGTMLWQLGKADDANGALDEALAIAEKAAMKELVGWVKVSRARLALSRGLAAEASSNSLEALKVAGPEMKAITIQANSSLGLAESMSGKAASGRRHCQEAVDLAATVRDPLPLSGALLALARVELAVGDTKAALETAARAQERYAAAKQLDGEWRARFIAALVGMKLNETDLAKQSAAQTNAILTTLKNSWKTEDYASYSSRPDVADALKTLAPLLN